MDIQIIKTVNTYNPNDFSDFFDFCTNDDLLVLVNGYIRSNYQHCKHISVDLIFFMVTYSKSKYIPKCPLCNHKIERVLQIYFH